MTEVSKETMLLLSLDRFGNRKFLEQCCHYTKLERSIRWDVVFDQKTPRNEAIRAFKQKLSEAIDNGCLYNMQDNPYVKDTLDSLMQKFSISEESFEKSLMSLSRLMLQQRISDDKVYDAIARISSKYVINLAMPSPSGLKENVTHYQEKPSLCIHPERKSHLEGVIGEVDDHNDAILRGKLFEEVKHKSSMCHSNINVGCLQEYLHKAEHLKDRKRYTWEGTRPYNWDRNNVDESLRWNAGDLLFSYGIRCPRRSSLFKLIKNSIDNRTHDNSSLQKSPRDILVYNVERRSKVVIPASHTNSIFNINYRDLFGIINGSGLAPDETLVIINQLEAEGWKLIGDLYDNSENVVFQRTTVVGQKDKSTASYKIMIIPLIAILTGLGISYFH